MNWKCILWGQPACCPLLSNEAWSRGKRPFD